MQNYSLQGRELSIRKMSFFTDLESSFSQYRSDLTSPPVSETFKQRFKSFHVNTLVLYERKLGRSVLGLAMVTSQKMSCLKTKRKCMISKEKSIRHVAMVAKFPDGNSESALFQTSSI